MTEAYDRKLRALAAAAGRDVGLALREGVYAASPGPQYETPAEVRMLRGFGADLVGMSTVPEVIAAVHMGARVLGLSCFTNLAAGVTGERLSHNEVTETAARVRDQFIALLVAHHRTSGGGSHERADRSGAGSPRARARALLALPGRRRRARGERQDLRRRQRRERVVRARAVRRAHRRRGRGLGGREEADGGRRGHVDVAAGGAVRDVPASAGRVRRRRAADRARPTRPARAPIRRWVPSCRTRFAAAT